MKSYQYVATGIFVALFIVMVIYALPKIFLKNEQPEADEIFNEYLSSKTQQQENIKLQQSQISSFIQNLQSVKSIIDNMQPPIDSTVAKADSLIVLNKLSDYIYETRRLIFNMLSDSSANQTSNLSRAISAIQNSFQNEFGSYIYMTPYNSNTSNSFIFLPIFNNYYNKSIFRTHQSNLSTAIAQRIMSLNNVSIDFNASIAKLDTLIRHTKIAQKDATENSRDKLLITMVIPIFAGMLAIIIFIPFFLRKNANLFNKILDDKILMQVFTIFILVISILLLGIGNKLTGETLGTLLGGISVYVLQKSLDNNGNNKPH